MFKFLSEESGASTTRVCVLILVISICFYICFGTATHRNIEWFNVGIFLGIVFGAKLIQKDIEVKNPKPEIISDQPTK